MKITSDQLYEILAKLYGPAKIEPPYTYPYSFPYDEGSTQRLVEALNEVWESRQPRS